MQTHTFYAIIRPTSYAKTSIRPIHSNHSPAYDNVKEGVPKYLMVHQSGFGPSFMSYLTCEVPWEVHFNLSS